MTVMTPVQTQLTQFLRTCAQRLVVMDDHPKAAAAGKALEQAMANATPLQCSRNQVPCLSQIEAATDTDLSRQVIAMSPDLNWIPSHRLTEQGKTVALMRADAMLDLGGVIAGLIFVGANEIYPEHEHEPQELYFTLSGEASWRQGGSVDYETIGPNRSFYNKPFDRHGVRAQTTPMLALYVLWDFASAGSASSSTASN